MEETKLAQVRQGGVIGGRTAYVNSQNMAATERAQLTRQLLRVATDTRVSVQ